VNDKDLKKIGIIAGVGLLGLAVVNGIYQAGFNAGIARGDNPSAVALHRDHGFFPFPPFLVLIGGVLLFVAWRRRWIGNGNGPGSGGRGPGGGGPPRFFEEWHRRAHEAAAEPPPPATPVPAQGSETGQGANTSMEANGPKIV
jgi:hypothetical protein